MLFYGSYNFKSCLVLSSIFTTFQTVNSRGITDTDISTTLTSSRHQRRHRQLDTMKELTMQNLSSCVSMMLCRMHGIKTMETSTINHQLFQNLLQSLTKQDGGSSEESSSEDDNQFKPTMDHNNVHDNQFKNEPRDSIERLANEGDGIFKRYGSRFPRLLFPSKPGTRIHVKFNNPFSKHQQLIRNNMDKSTYSDLNSMRTALQYPRLRTSRQCNSRHLRITWIRSKYPPRMNTSTPSQASSAVMAEPESNESCPYNFSELQKMLLDAFGGLLMTAGGLQLPTLPSKETPMQRPPKDEALQKLMANSSSIPMPYTVYANIKLPITISTDETKNVPAMPVYNGQLQLQSQSTSIKNKKPSQIPTFADFFRRTGLFNINYKNREIRKRTNPRISKSYSKPAKLLQPRESFEDSNESDEIQQNTNVYNIQSHKPGPSFGKLSYEFGQWIATVRKTFAAFQQKIFSTFQNSRSSLTARPLPLRYDPAHLPKYKHRIIFYRDDENYISSEDSREE